MPQRRTVEEKSARRTGAGKETDDERTPQDDRDGDTAGLEVPESSRRRHRGKDGDGSRLVSAAAAAEAGLRSIVELTGKRPEGVTAVEPTDDGWLVGVEVIEDQRVPSSADILAMYEAELNADGGLVSYRRTKRYSRSRGDDCGDA